jgi:ribonuclease BN (tRNA processing enzyme)
MPLLTKRSTPDSERTTDGHPPEASLTEQAPQYRAGCNILGHCDVTEVGGVAERANVGELILNHYLPPEPNAITDAAWAERGGRGFKGKTTAGSDGLRRRLTGESR